MKATTYLAAIAAFSFTATAYAADVTVNITGATAFRAATLLAIRSRFNDSGAVYKFAHDQATAGGTTYSGATRAIFIGTFPGVTGTTTIRCCFNGSVEGIRSLVGVADPVPPTYYQPSLLDSTTAIVGGAELHNQGTTGATTPSPTGDIAFSDVSKAITPYASYTLQPASPPCGVVVFTMLTNEGSTITNVTAQQFRALLAGGFQPLRLFTGVSTDTTNVFVTGRNDGSGTRSSYLAETGFGASNPVKQYVMVDSTSTEIKALQLVPAGGVNDSDSGTSGIQLPPGSDIKAYDDGPRSITQLVANASTVWGQDVDGNGGYSSGSTLRTDMGKTGASGVTVFDETGTDSFGGTVRADLITWLSLNDALTARGNGAIVCGYNGIKLDNFAAGTINSLTATGSPAILAAAAADREKVTEGAYTAWNFQQMYCRNGLYSGDVKTVYDGIKAEIPTNLGAAGLTLTSMHVGRPNDGGTVAP